MIPGIVAKTAVGVNSSCQIPCNAMPPLVEWQHIMEVNEQDRSGGVAPRFAKGLAHALSMTFPVSGVTFHYKPGLPSTERKENQGTWNSTTRLTTSAASSVGSAILLAYTWFSA